MRTKGICKINTIHHYSQIITFDESNESQDEIVVMKRPMKEYVPIEEFLDPASDEVLLFSDKV